jgi:exopolysaccharide production protein ExoZ
LAGLLPKGADRPRTIPRSAARCKLKYRTAGKMQKLQGLQALRAIAALLVLVQHAVYYASLSSNTHIERFLSLRLGAIGVYLFFCISGTVMAFASHSSSPGTFFARRVSRIYPPFLIALVLAYLVIRLSPDHYAGPFSRDWSLLLIPTGTLDSSFLVPYWTLVYEMFFYAVVFVLLLLRTSTTMRAWGMVAWSILILGIAAWAPAFDQTAPNLAHIAISPLNLYFTTGYVLGTAILTRNHYPMLATVIALGTSSAFTVGQSSQILGCCAMNCGLIYLVTSVQTWPGWVTQLGDYSYGFYLMHLSAIHAASYYVARSGASLLLGALELAAAGMILGLPYGYIENRVFTRLVRPLTERLMGTASPSTRAKSVLPGANGQAPPVPHTVPTHYSLVHGEADADSKSGMPSARRKAKRAAK